MKDRHHELTGYTLSNKLREVAEDTANPERFQLLMNAAAEIESLIKELKELQSQITRP